MSNRLSPERIAEIREYRERGGCNGVLMAEQITDLFDHIEAIEAELTAYRSWHENMSLEASKQEQRAVDAELELAEAKAEIARLKSILNTMWTQG